MTPEELQRLRRQRLWKEHLEELKAKEARKWYAKPENKQKQHEYYLRWKENNPEAYAAKLEKARQRRKAKKDGSQDPCVDA